jgi:hypothetical protein
MGKATLKRGGAVAALGAILAMASSGPALAQWVTEVETGTKGAVLATMSGTINSSAELIVQCTNNGKAALALILEDSITPPSDSAGAATMTIKSDRGEAQTGPATILRNNKKFIAVNWTVTSVVPSIVHDIKDAQKTIEVAFAVEGGASSGRYEVSAVGSTDASKTLESACFGDGDGGDSALTPPPRN